MQPEPLSPELALVDPELRARALAALPDPVAAPRSPRVPVPSAAPPAAPVERHRPYPFWARVTAALWLVVLGILIGGAAIPHAQDRPRIVPADEDATAVCEMPETPAAPERGSPLRPGR